MPEIQLMQGDCLEKMKDIPDKSIDMILCDLPYGIKNSRWDKIIPFEPLWEQYNRIIKSQKAILLFGREPFSSYLRISNVKMFKYDWVWQKNSSADGLNAKNKPMNIHENILCFSDGNTANRNQHNMVYYPQGLRIYGKLAKSGNKQGRDGSRWRPSTNNKPYIQQYTNYPTTVLHFKKPSKAVHPTQKPVDLLEYLIRTYTNEGETVLDNCMGSGSTGVACVNTGRNFIGIELDEDYFNIAKKRINKAVEGKGKRDE